MKNYTCIIIGSGIAAIQFAKHLDKETTVLMITKSTLKSSNSYRAQGGIAAAVAKSDDPLFHYEDTLQAGCSFQNEHSVKELVENGPSLIEELTCEGLSFDKDAEGELSLGLEGAHSQNRILHCGGDATGSHIVNHLLTKLQSNIEVIENHFVYELIIHPITKACIGIKSKDAAGNNHTYLSNQVVLAVGGIGGLFAFTSNDLSVAGDGIALAYRAGAEVIDMEFIQFHPTLLFANNRTYGLVSEAVRGEGACLVNECGTRIMEGIHPMKDLGPRHIVSMEIYEQRRLGHDVFLDISMIQEFEKKFPTITSLCAANGISLNEKRIPVAPGCHFLMGGVVVDTVGQTTLKGLFAIGETASTGVHGANRLASNSLLEALHYGEKVAKYINTLSKSQVNYWPLVPEMNFKSIKAVPEKQEIREKMMAYAGIIRSETGLIHLKNWLNDSIKSSEMDISLDHYPEDEVQRLFMLQTAKLVTSAALLREESRGAHCREDFQDEDTKWRDLHIVQSKKATQIRSRMNEHNQVEIYA